MLSHLTCYLQPTLCLWSTLCLFFRHPDITLFEPEVFSGVNGLNELIINFHYLKFIKSIINQLI